MSRKWMKVLLVAVFTVMFGNLAAVNLVDMYMDGGPFMHIIAGLFVVMIVVALVKFFQLSITEKLDTKRFYLKLKGYIANDQFGEAVEISSQFKKTTMGFIFWNGLVAFLDAKKAGKKGFTLQKDVQNAFDEAGLQKMPSIEAGLFWLDIIAQVATLLGLLGTIFGLVAAFDALANAPENLKQKMLTEGISQAMGTTAWGLLVAIPTMGIKGALQAKADKIVNDIDEYSVKIINRISYKIED
ncbi:MAG: MotA/TolQ/ExbB proton channel family protein [Candidatus Cloacimonetes bacterium]|jgi:biopolymer transport protein ExbB|nr:MotA/TolQ/ExbB proton channel family protein [Candidatus Cloacimonadota bacterium]MBT6993919.1 MotA/TolQ/ExbB proton channel family protein [Candidatus Cloacimonadota bacterium]MBT7469313.1 MotA/TolQ/ExbB proton channel family protein [Candidatus Cloacimonadota bacterium]